MNLLAILEKQSKPFLITVGFILIVGIGILDLATGYELAFSLFYLIPISLIAWLTTRYLGIMASLTSTLVWLIADIEAGNSYSHPFIYVWNTLIRFSLFVIIVFLLSGLKKVLERETRFARMDHLTSAVNSRFFYEVVQTELDRFQRYGHPFTLAYIDLDNFKTVNDQLGHFVGDEVLCAVVSCAKKHLRKSDVVARLGGDEFALLLPETNPISARATLSKIQRVLLDEMQRRNWPVTFSIGVMTCRAALMTSDELVRMADELMYSVKRSGKNAIKYSIYTG